MPTPDAGLIQNRLVLLDESFVSKGYSELNVTHELTGLNFDTTASSPYYL